MRKAGMQWIVLASLAVGALGNGAVGAATEAPPQKQDRRHTAAARANSRPAESGYGERTKNVSFDPEDIVGDVADPGGFVIDGNRASDFSSLIQIRGSFRSEIIKSAEDL